jgi:hypothetical protein
MNYYIKHLPVCGAKYGAPNGAATAGAPHPLASPGGDGGAFRGAGRSLYAEYGAEYGARYGAQPQDAECVIYRLEEAGSTLLALPNTGYSTRLRSGALEVVRDAAESYGWQPGRIRPPVPDAARITRMDEALGWIRLIPADRVVLRRIVGCRALVSPITERHLFSWRRLGSVVGADHKAVQRWHAVGIDAIVAALGRSGR